MSMIIFENTNMTKVNPGTKRAEAMIYEWKNCFKGDSIYAAYGKCSSDKQSSFEAIRCRACETIGYNHDLKITSANCYHYSTMYSVTNNDGTFLIKDTVGNTFILKIA